MTSNKPNKAGGRMAKKKVSPKGEAHDMYLCTGRL